MFGKLKEKLVRTKDALINKVEQVVRHTVTIDEEFYETIEETLLLADVGMNTATMITDRVRERCTEEKPTDPDRLMDLVREVIADFLVQGGAPDESEIRPGLNVIMITGVNGSGKTTSTGKLAALYKQQGYNVMLAACDTYRAAAVEQLEIWSERAGVPIVRQQEGTDPSAVMFDAVQAARARNIDVLLADTAGRLHTQVNLMEELKKIRRIATGKAGVENFRSWLVLDSTIGQNSVSQARLFNEAVTIEGLVITKLDGTARGGIVLSVINEWKLPIEYIGVGEKIEDLVRFDQREFAKALLGEGLEDYWEKKQQQQNPAQ